MIHTRSFSLITIIKILQDHMFLLESQYLNHDGNISWELSLSEPNYNESNYCGREHGYEEYHDYIMILNDQSTSHTLLKPHIETKPINHLSSRAFYPHACDGNFDYENE